MNNNVNVFRLVYEVNDESFIVYLAAINPDDAVDMLQSFFPKAKISEAGFECRLDNATDKAKKIMAPTMVMNAPQNVKVVERVVEKIVEKEVGVPEKTYMCCHCDKEMDNKTSMKKHMAWHERESSFTHTPTPVQVTEVKTETE